MEILIFKLTYQIEELKRNSNERFANYSSAKMRVSERVLSGTNGSASSEVVSKPITIPMSELQSRAGQISVRLAVQDLLLSKLKKENDMIRSKILNYTSDLLDTHL